MSPYDTRYRSCYLVTSHVRHLSPPANTSFFHTSCCANVCTYLSSGISSTHAYIRRTTTMTYSRQHIYVCVSRILANSSIACFNSERNSSMSSLVCGGHSGISSRGHQSGRSVRLMRSGEYIWMPVFVPQLRVTIPLFQLGSANWQARQRSGISISLIMIIFLSRMLVSHLVLSIALTPCTRSMVSTRRINCFRFHVWASLLFTVSNCFIQTHSTVTRICAS